MIFICTCSQDTSTDILLPLLNGTSTFRFDIDKPENFTWDFSKQGFTISDLESGKTIDSENLSSFYLRKPLYINAIDVPKEGCLENWRRKETDALFEDLYRHLESLGRTAVVHSRNSQYGKFRQLLVAANHFRVADWHIIHGQLTDDLKEDKWVAKTLTGTSIGKNKAFFVKEVNPSKLDLSYPWFLQKKIDGEDEVTVVYVNGQALAYHYPRTEIRTTDDVRLATLEDTSKWEPCELSDAERTAIRGFMAETGYSFGRFDFIRKDGELWFLEMNPNGQWAWLDEKNENGLISAIADAIIAEDLAHQHDTSTASVHATQTNEPGLSRRRLRIM